MSAIGNGLFVGQDGRREVIDPGGGGVGVGGTWRDAAHPPPPPLKQNGVFTPPPQTTASSCLLGLKVESQSFVSNPSDRHFIS
jgi:hypothetical protein